tara:strand:+ start:296 stop:451 length:156 start_codon:yes stop_codon:yes gene_type:complete
MGCKDDDTCDQPATRGDLEVLMWAIPIVTLFLYGSALMVGSMVENAITRKD